MWVNILAKKVNNKKQETKKGYTNPMSTIWGKVIIILLCLAMVGGILYSLISAIITNFGNV